MLLGLLLGWSLQRRSICPLGFTAVQVLLWWVPYCVSWAVPCMITIDTSAYTAHNAELAARSEHNNAPHMQRADRARAAPCAALAVCGGACAALSLALGPQWSHGDVHVLSLAVVVLSVGRLRRGLATVLALYVWLSRAIPSVHGIVRAVVTVLAVVLHSAVLPPLWHAVRLGCSILTIFAFVPSCTSRLGAVSPATLLWFAAHQCGLSPVPILAFALFVLLF